MTKKVWDAIVVGGGMVGSVVALGLAKQDLNVLILENKPPNLKWDKNYPLQTRVSAITRYSENILRNLGCWQGIKDRRYFPFTNMHIWETASNTQINLTAKEVNEPNLGCVVENSVIQASIWEQCHKQTNIDFILNDEIKSLKLTDNSDHKEMLTKNKLDSNTLSKLILKNAGTLSANLIIGADGAFSKIRQLANIGLDSSDYNQCVIVGCVETEMSHQNTCWQRYTLEGPFAFLAMNNNFSSIAWYLPIEKMQWALNLSNDEYAQAITKASGQKLGKVIKVFERCAFPLVRRHAQQYIKSGLALVGDAAHTVNPQAGQGVNMGFMDAAALLDVINEAKQKKHSISCTSVLRRYERWRKADNVIVQRSMEIFERLFIQKKSIVYNLRKLFLPMVNKLSPVKQWLIKEALYGRKPLPKLTKFYK